MNNSKHSKHGTNITQATHTSSQQTFRICLMAMLITCVFCITRFIQIPIPLGYFNIGNSIILAICLLIPSPDGIIIGAVGSGLADLLSYPVYTVPTLLIKALMPFIFYKMMTLPIKNDFLKKGLACAISTLIPLFGYTITGGILYGGFMAGLAQFPGLLIEYLANLCIFLVLAKSGQLNKLAERFHPF